MRLKLALRFMLFAVLCIYLAGGEMWLRNAPAFNSGRIVFTSGRDGNNEIYVMDADGGNQENLTNHPAYDAQPDWSPDGTKIAFVSRRDGVSQIYVMDADGKNSIRLTIGWRSKSAPDWSPDGQKIAFTVNPAFNEVSHHIALMDGDGRNRERLEDHVMYPSWSPDGKHIACVSFRDGHGDIYVMGAGGQGLERVARSLGGDRPSFSPDGQRIAYMAEHKGFSHIHVVDSDGRNLQRLTHNEENHWDPTWSPDGRTIAYGIWDGILEGKLHGTIHLIASNGRYIRQLSDGRNARDYQPDISPLGFAVSPASKTTIIWGRLKLDFVQK